MALSRVQYQQQTQGTRTFTVPFPYISKDHIKVAVNGTDVTYTWTNPTTVQLATAPALGDIIDVRRETERERLLVDFQDASTITESQLDLMAQQSFYIAQEAFDATGGTLAIANDGSYSANNRRISNIGTPDSDDDVVSAGWVKGQYSSGKDAHQERLLAETARTGAETARDAAKTAENTTLGYRNTANDHRLAAASSASAAKTSETNAANSATAAKSSETTVAADATAAKNSATAAKASEDAALTSKNSAASSASSASANATSASDSSAKASLWAEANEDAAVELGKYSSKHYAAKASASSSSASTSASNALTYRDAANTAKTGAEAAKAAAKTSETNAKTSETNAKASEDAAAASAASLDANNLVRKDIATTISAKHTYYGTGELVHYGDPSNTAAAYHLGIGATGYGWEIGYDGATSGLVTGNTLYLKSNANTNGLRLQHDGKAFVGADAAAGNQLITRKMTQEFMRCVRTITSSFSANVWTTVPYDTVSYDSLTCATYNGSTGKWSITEDCVISLTAFIHVACGTPNGSAAAYVLEVWIDGISHMRISQHWPVAHSGMAIGGSTVLGLAKGATVEVKVYMTGTNPSMNDTSPQASYAMFARLG